MPVAAVATACPRSVSPRRTALRIASSSSTTRMLVMPERYVAGRREPPVRGPVGMMQS